MTDALVPEVTAIATLYNCGPALEGALRLLAATDLTDCELLVIDDCSSDGTGEVAQRFAASTPGARYLRNDQNLGVAATRNRALTHARGRYVWFLDWDDDWEPGIVQSLLRTAKAENADVVVCRAMRIAAVGENGPVIDGLPRRVVMSGEETFELALRGRIQGYLWCKLLRRDRLPEPMFPIQRSQSDFGGLVPVLASAQRVATVSEVLYRHVLRPGSITNVAEAPLDGLRASRQVVHRTAATLPTSRRLERLLDYYDYRLLYLALANTACRLGVTDDYVNRYLAEAVEGMRWSRLPAVARISVGTAARCALVKVADRRYVDVYRGYIRLRGAAKRRWRPGARGGRP